MSAKLGQVLTQVAACDKEDVDRAVKAARAAFEKGVWSRMAGAERKKAPRRIARQFAANWHEELDALLDQQGTLFDRQLMAHPRGVATGQRERPAKYR